MRKNEEVKYQELHEIDIQYDILDNFQRYQEVSKVWRNENGVKVIKETSFIEDWDSSKKQKIINELKQTIVNNGMVFGAFHNNQLIGFAAICGIPIGRHEEYVQLLQLHVSMNLRGEGIGKTLFNLCKEKARSFGGRKLYISSHSSIETQAFYKKMGCVDAEWINKQQVELEPFDCQLEYEL